MVSEKACNQKYKTIAGVYTRLLIGTVLHFSLASSPGAELQGATVISDESVCAGYLSASGLSPVEADFAICNHYTAEYQHVSTCMMYKFWRCKRTGRNCTSSREWGIPGALEESNRRFACHADKPDLWIHGDKRSSDSSSLSQATKHSSKSFKQKRKSTCKLRLKWPLKIVSNEDSTTRFKSRLQSNRWTQVSNYGLSPLQRKSTFKLRF